MRRQCLKCMQFDESVQERCSNCGGCAWIYPSNSENDVQNDAAPVERPWHIILWSSLITAVAIYGVALLTYPMTFTDALQLGLVLIPVSLAIAFLLLVVAVNVLRYVRWPDSNRRSPSPSQSSSRVATQKSNTLETPLSVPHSDDLAVRPALVADAESQAIARQRMQQLMSSPYFLKCLELTETAIRNQTVMDATAGNRGLALYLDDGTWIAEFLVDDHMEFRVGDGRTDITELINSDDYGDVSQPVSDPLLPYGDRCCDHLAEVRNSIGQILSAISIGSDCFNFCFKSNWELEVLLCKDSLGKSAYRLFWVNWNKAT